MRKELFINFPGTKSFFPAVINLKNYIILLCSIIFAKADYVFCFGDGIKVAKNKSFVYFFIVIVPALPTVKAFTKERKLVKTGRVKA